MSPLKKFRRDIAKRSALYKTNADLQSARKNFHDELVKINYAYNFFWLGIPIIQEPQDMQAMQEIIWEVKPDLIIETGIAWGGSIIFSASMLALLEACGKIVEGEVLGIDIDIRPHNKKAISDHPLSKKIIMLEGSSIDEKIVRDVTEIAKRKKRVLVCLDSNHTHDHVLSELQAYAPLVSSGSYCIVGDTGVEDLPENALFGRPWGRGNSPKSAVEVFLKENKNFVVDYAIESKLILTGAPGGYLKKIN